MAEQGDIDWANHANDLPRMLGAMHSLDEAVRAVEAWVDEPGDDIDWDNTLLIVTADHATGLPRFDSSLAPAKGVLPTASYSTIGHGERARQPGGAREPSRRGPGALPRRGAAG